MTNEFLAFAPIYTAPAVDPAGALLDEMMARVGVDGLAAALGDTGLLAQVDQHAAAVRDALRAAGRVGGGSGGKRGEGEEFVRHGKDARASCHPLTAG